MKKIIIALLLNTWAIAILANGWHISTRYYTLPQEQSFERNEEVFLLNGYMKMVSGSLITVFDLVKNEISYINTSNRTYWRGNPQRFLAEVRAELEASIEDKLYGIDKDQQETMREIYMEMIEASFPEGNSASIRPKPFKVHIEKDGDIISGFSTTRYMVTEDGLPLESIWVTSELQIAKDFDFISLNHFLNQLAQGAYAASFESSQEYFKLLEKGYPVKVEIPRGDGTSQISEVTNAKRISLKTSDFSVPTGFSPSTLTSVGVWDGYM